MSDEFKQKNKIEVRLEFLTHIGFWCVGVDFE